ncbi:MAG: sulfurtransferase [Gammaproteobacteria bacterium]|jgi:thiosulfate/3-mercaptopyruvate sulfurtransferase
MNSLVSTTWLQQHLTDPDLVVLDCSVVTVQHEDGSFHNESGRAEYEKGHIPGAGFADLKGELCDPESDVEFAIPEPAAFCQAMERLGVGNDSRVVLYDSVLSAWAARVWWMLRWVGFDRAAVLDGGFSAWTGEGRPVSGGPSGRKPAQLTPAIRPGLIADRDEVMLAITDDKIMLVDTLPAVYYCGEEQMYARPGHIPGAINLCGTDYLDDSGHYKPLEEIEGLLDLDRNCRAITYCGGGILASLNAFVMTRLGYQDVAVYTASLQEWASDPDNPMSLCS